MAPDSTASSAPPPADYRAWTPAEYIRGRVDQYIGWYDGKAVRNKRDYLLMRTTIVLGGVIVPVVVSTTLPGKDLVASLIGLLVAAMIALEGVYHYREQWKNYRSTEQFLSREKVLFLTGEGGYRKAASAAEAFVHFVERCEGAIESENAATLNVMTLGQQEAKPSSTT